MDDDDESGMVVRCSIRSWIFFKSHLFVIHPDVQRMYFFVFGIWVVALL